MKIFGFVLFLQDVMLMLIMSDKNKKRIAVFEQRKSSVLLAPNHLVRQQVRLHQQKRTSISNH